MALVEYLDIDDDVNVYVVGDIHADYEGLMEAQALEEMDRIEKLLGTPPQMTLL